MSDIKIAIGKNVKRSAVLINPNRPALDRTILNNDGEVKEVIKSSNVISEGTTSQEAVRKMYGKRF